jgi:hypothetical protein
MHLLIPFAACQDPASRPLLRGLRLPQLEQLLAQLAPLPLAHTPEEAPALPHEYAQAQALGLDHRDPLPWAAWQAHGRGLDATQAWAFISPCHWQVGQARVTLDHPAALALTEDESRTLLAAMQPYFAEDGITLVFDSAGRWLARGEVFRDLVTASLARVIGRDIAPWLPPAPALRRLQTEMQMLLYTHPVSEARSERGALPVNSFWLSGSGALATPPVAATQPPRVPQQLADAALRGDWSAWAQAWQQLDATEGAALLAALQQGQSVTLTLCGERASQTFTTAPRSLLRRLTGLWQRPALPSLLEQL